MGPVKAANGGVKRDPLTGEDILEEPCGQFTISEEGSMTPEEFDGAIYDLVNFLAYTAEPMAADRQRIGIFVLLFIAVFFVFASLLIPAMISLALFRRMWLLSGSDRHRNSVRPERVPTRDPLFQDIP